MQDAQHNESAPNPGLIFGMINAHQQTAAINAAIELDIFRSIGEGPGDVASIARHANASERGIRILCDFLAMHGILSKHGSHFHHTPTSAVFLDPRSPASIASVAQFMNSAQIHDVYADLAGVIRNGRTHLAGEGTVEPENPLWVEFAHKMVPMTGPLAGPLSALVLEDQAQAGHTRPMRVLDIAAGHGLFGIEIAKNHPHAQITGVDWAPVLEVSFANATKAGVHHRYHKIPGSAFDVEFGGPYNAVLLTNFLHHFDHATNIGLLKKVHAALEPGGCAATLEFIPDGGRTSPPVPVGFTLTMLTTTASGNAYTFSELKAMYEEAGFHSVTLHPIPMSAQTAVLGRA